MGFSLELLNARRRIKELEAKVLNFPEPPQGQVVINSQEIFSLLHSYGIVLSGGTEDWNYLLMSREEANRFMKWYKQNAPIKPSDYTPDDIDCGDFAWIMRAFALIWSKGKYLWGYTESESAEPNYPFPNHGFCFITIDDKTLWFADPLNVAAPDDEIGQAFMVKSYAAKC